MRSFGNCVPGHIRLANAAPQDGKRCHPRALVVNASALASSEATEKVPIVSQSLTQPIKSVTQCAR